MDITKILCRVCTLLFLEQEVIGINKYSYGSGKSGEGLKAGKWKPGKWKKYILFLLYLLNAVKFKNLFKLLFYLYSFRRYDRKRSVFFHFPGFHFPAFRPCRKKCSLYSVLRKINGSIFRMCTTIQQKSHSYSHFNFTGNSFGRNISRLIYLNFFLKALVSCSQSYTKAYKRTNNSINIAVLSILLVMSILTPLLYTLSQIQIKLIS